MCSKKKYECIPWWSSLIWTIHSTQSCIRFFISFSIVYTLCAAVTNLCGEEILYSIGFISLYPSLFTVNNMKKKKRLTIIVDHLNINNNIVLTSNGWPLPPASIFSVVRFYSTRFDCFAMVSCFISSVADGRCRSMNWHKEQTTYFSLHACRMYWGQQPINCVQQIEQCTWYWILGPIRCFTIAWQRPLCRWTSENCEVFISAIDRSRTNRSIKYKVNGIATNRKDNLKQHSRWLCLHSPVIPFYFIFFFSIIHSFIHTILISVSLGRLVYIRLLCVFISDLDYY